MNRKGLDEGKEETVPMVLNNKLNSFTVRLLAFDILKETYFELGSGSCQQGLGSSCSRATLFLLFYLSWSCYLNGSNSFLAGNMPILPARNWR